MMQMEIFMRGSTKTEGRTGREYYTLRTRISLRENGLKGSDMGRVIFMKANIKMIKRVDLVIKCGKMGINMKVNGKTGKDMVLA